MESESILDGIRLDFPGGRDLLSTAGQLPHRRDLAARRAATRRNGFAVVPAGETATFAYDIHADVSGEAIGFDALMIFTPSTAVFREFHMGRTISRWPR